MKDVCEPQYLRSIQIFKYIYSSLTFNFYFNPVDCQVYTLKIIIELEIFLLFILIGLENGAQRATSGSQTATPVIANKIYNVLEGRLETHS